MASPAGDAVPDSHMTRLFADNEDRDVLVWGSAGGMPTERGVGCLRGVFRVPLDLNDKHHMTGKPVALMQKVNAICAPGGVILDPFAGSSSTGVAALRDGYRFIGIEKTDAYAALSRERLTAEAAGMPYGAKAQRRGQLTLVG